LWPPTNEERPVKAISDQQTNMYGTVTGVEEQPMNVVVWVRSDTEPTPFPQPVGFPTRGEFAVEDHEVLDAQLAKRAVALEVGQEVTISYVVVESEVGGGGDGLWRKGTGLSE
jgi:hypothetical protein